MTEDKKSSFSKPTTNSEFHIDFDWWKNKDENWKSILAGYCCDTHKVFFSSHDSEPCLIDSVDPQTGEVTQTDQFLDVVMSHCAQTEGFIPENGAVTDTIFRLLLKNRNEPMTIREIADILNRPAEAILRTLTARTYRGIRPVL